MTAMPPVRSSRKRSTAAVLSLIAGLSLSAAADGGLAPTPPMGWSSWNSFGCAVDEKLIRETAGALLDSGLAAAGYRYVNIDDCWQAPKRGPAGELQADPQRFPSGMKALADYLHARGLKLGLYTSVGTRTCEGRPGSLGHELQDAELFAAWGADFVKDDFCGGPLWTRFTFWPWWSYRARYQAMADGLRRSGRPIILSLCTWGFGRPWEWDPAIGHLWRTYWDIRPNWHWILRIADAQQGLEAAAGPGRWNDPDMLEVGVAPLTEVESRAHFSLWAILAAPLIAGNDVRSMTPAVRDILANPEVIAVDQDPAGRQGRRVASSGAGETWARPLSGKGRRVAVVLLNRGERPQKIAVDWSAVGLDPRRAARMRDLWARRDLGTASDGFAVTVPPHGAAMLTAEQD